MHLATIRLRGTFVLALSCRRLDRDAGKRIVDLVKSSVAQGATTVVLDFGPFTTLDFDGARALEDASALLGSQRNLVAAGLSTRARTLLRSLRLVDRVRLVEWWTDAVESAALAA